MFFFASVALINPSMHHNDNGTMQKCFFLGLRNINLSKNCHRIPAFSLFLKMWSKEQMVLQLCIIQNVFGKRQ